jgi:hypothetical protein
VKILQVARLLILLKYMRVAFKVFYIILLVGWSAAVSGLRKKKTFEREIVMEGQYGIENIKRLFSIGASLAMAAETSVPAWKDGKLDAQDFAFLPDLFSIIGDIMALRFDQVVPEIKDLSAAEMVELGEFFKERLVMQDKSNEEALEAGLLKIMGTVKFIHDLMKIYGRK